MSPDLRTDLFITTAQTNAGVLEAKARACAAELNAPFVPRRETPFAGMFAERPEARRALVVQTERLLLVDREEHTFFYHPNMAFPRLGNLLRGQPDLLITAAGLKAGDSVLDATLGFASEATLCAHVVGDSGEVHGIEAIPELGLVVREGLKTVQTHRIALNAAMRRVQVVHLGDHLDYLRACPDARYDVVCFDPFFEDEPTGSEQFASLRHFGDHAALTRDALTEARRIARRRVLVKTLRWSPVLEELGITQRCETRSGIVVYGIF